MNDLIKMILSLPYLSLNKDEWALIFDIIQQLNAEKKEILEQALAQTTIEQPYVADIVSHMEPWHKTIPLPVPNVPLTDKEIADIATIFNAYYQKRCSGLQKRLTQTRVKTASIIPIIKYVDMWDDTADMFLHWITQHVFVTWSKINKNSPCGADSMVPLILEMLPDEIKYLKLVLEKLNQAEEIEQRGETACYLVSLHIAIETKIREKELAVTVAQPQPDKKIMLVANELLLQDKVSILFAASMDYLNELLDTFFIQLKTRNKSIHAKYCSSDNMLVDRKKIMESIIMAMIAKTLELNDEVLQIYISKYDALIDLQASLTRENEHTHTRLKLIEFAKKFTHHRIILQKTTDTNAIAFFKSSGAMMGFDRLYYMLQQQSKEDIFMDMAALISKLFHLEEEKQMQEDKSRPINSV